MVIWIDEVIWDDRNVDHIARHRVTIFEVEEVLYEGQLRAYRSRGGTHTIFGQTAAGRHLMIVLRRFDIATWYPITARDMTDSERSQIRK